MDLDEQTLRALFDRSQKANPDKMHFTEEESNRFQKSFEDPEFRKLFADYMDELSDPKNREETEAYITQLEGEQKVPEGKELIRPEPAFVAKSFKIINKDASGKEKVFMNIVKSDKISVPSKTTTPKGTCWSVPYSLGPPHMEKDKNGSNAPCFDCCFHPDAIALGMQHKEFKDLLVNTAMEGVEKLYQQQGQDVTINREFHIVKGLAYKQGPVPTMMIAVAAKENWKDKDGKAATEKDSKKAAPTAKPAAAAATTVPPVPAKDQIDLSAELEAPDVTDKPKSTLGPAIKKGFLSNSKGAIYGDKLTTLRKKTPSNSDANNSTGAGISLVDQPPAAGGMNNLNIPSTSTATRASKTGSASSLIQEVKPGDKTSPVPNPTSAGNTKSAASASVVGGLTAVSTTKRTPVAPAAPVPSASSTSSSTPLSPSGRREVAVTSPSGSDVNAELEESTEAEAEAEGALEKPKYTMKERGVVSMGDFENMNTTARSNRPSELVYRVELPKIAKASQIVLDIAERQLNLSYPDMYSLSLRLPYPVFDTKGTAKYDKASKSLTVTLPVRPPPAAAVVTPSPAKAAESAVSEVEAQDETSETSPQKPSTPAKKSSVGHGRWVESPASSGTASGAVAPVESEGLSLHEEIKRQAEIALREAQAAAKAAPAKTAPLPAAVTTAAPPTAPVATTLAAASLEGNFIPCTSFNGKKAGYVFKRGDQGVGYYVDAKYAAKAPAPASVTPSVAATSAPAVAPPVHPVVEHLPFPFECRQTKSALAIIVEVPYIDKASLRVEFETHSVHVSFRAFADVPAEGNTPTSTTTVGAVQYGAVLQLRQEDCPGGLDISLCRFDAQKQNLAIVLTKAQAQFWHCSSSTADNSSTENRDAVLADGESKSGDATSDETRHLLRVIPISGDRTLSTDASATTAASTEALPPPPAPVSTQKANAANAEVAKALKSLESTIQVMQFSSSDALFELD